MAVITRYIVVRNGVELNQVFEDKKEADAYDKMLDAAENLAAFIKQGGLQVDLDEKTVDEISIYLAKNAPQVIQIFKGIKPLTPATPPADFSEKSDQPASASDKNPRGKKPAAKLKDQ